MPGISTLWGRDKQETVSLLSSPCFPPQALRPGLCQVRRPPLCSPVCHPHPTSSAAALEERCRHLWIPMINAVLLSGVPWASARGFRFGV